MLTPLLFSDIDWNLFLMGDEKWSFLIEASLRTFIMFIIIVVGLRLLGKRGVKQLSVFELVVIIGLGTAAGDPMLYKNLGILPALVVFVMVILLYRVIIYFVGRNKKFESLIEGKPVCLIKNGVFSIENFSKEALGEDEFFTELRMQNVSQLGQIEEAIMESSGSISIFYYPDTEVKYGLPIMPDSEASSISTIMVDDYYACNFCGHTMKLEAGNSFICPSCKKSKCIKASNKKRIS